MAFNTAPGRAEYTASAAQTKFTFAFKIFDTSDMKVYLTPVGQTANDTTDILVETTDYTISINGDNGGDVTLTSGATLNDSITLVRELPTTRETEYQNNGDLQADTLNEDQDYQTYLILDGATVSERALVIPDSVQSFNTEIPSPIANKLLVFNNAADGFNLLDTSSTGFFNDAFIVESVAAMTGVDPNLYGSVIARGYYVANDGGGGLFNYDATQSAINNGGTIIDGWVRQYGGAINARWFGAKGDGVTDDTTAFLNAVNLINSESGLLEIPNGTFIVNDTMEFTKVSSGIVGIGGLSTIERTDGTFGDTLVVGRQSPSVDQYRNFTLSNLEFVCYTDMTTGAVLRFRNCTRIFANNFFINNHNIGIQTEGIRDSNFTDFQMVAFNGNYNGNAVRPNAHSILIDEPADATLKSTETSFTGFNMTTAGNTNDVDSCLRVAGYLDGIWFSNGHWFGGGNAGCIIDGAGVEEISSVIFNNVWFDQFTTRNLQIQGITNTTKFRYMTFNNCRFFGGEEDLVAIDSASNLTDISFNGCEFGVCPNNGIVIGAGSANILNCTFKDMNKGLNASSFALLFLSTLATDVLTVSGCVLDVDNLQYGLKLNSVDAMYSINGNTFHNSDGSVSDIYYPFDSLNGAVDNNITDDITADNATASTEIITQTNIVSNTLNIEGALGNIKNIIPVWHKRRLTIKADAAIQSLVNTGTGDGVIRNKGGAASVDILASDMVIYQFNKDSNRWHEL